MDILKLSVCFFMLLFFCGCGEADPSAAVPAVRGFRPEAYMGIWYEIARLPNRFECGMSQVSAEYSLLPDGKIKVVNRGRRGGEERSVIGSARFRGSAGIGELEVSFQWPFYSAYRIIYLEKDCSLAAVCGSSRRYLWILARTPSVSEKRLRQLVIYLKKQRFDVDKLESGQFPDENFGRKIQKSVP